MIERYQYESFQKLLKEAIENNEPLDSGKIRTKFSNVFWNIIKDNNKLKAEDRKKRKDLKTEIPSNAQEKLIELNFKENVWGKKYPKFDLHVNCSTDKEQLISPWLNEADSKTTNKSTLDTGGHMSNDAAEKASLPKKTHFSLAKRKLHVTYDITCSFKDKKHALKKSLSDLHFLVSHWSQETRCLPGSEIQVVYLSEDLKSIHTHQIPYDFGSRNSTYYIQRIHSFVDVNLRDETNKIDSERVIFIKWKGVVCPLYENFTREWVKGVILVDLLNFSSTVRKGRFMPSI